MNFFQQKSRKLKNDKKKTYFLLITEDQTGDQKRSNKKLILISYQFFSKPHIFRLIIAFFCHEDYPKINKLCLNNKLWEFFVCGF